MINPQWPEQPISRTNFHGHKDVRAVEVRLYLETAPNKVFVSTRNKKSTEIFLISSWNHMYPVLIRSASASLFKWVSTTVGLGGDIRKVFMWILLLSILSNWSWSVIGWDKLLIFHIIFVIVCTKTCIAGIHWIHLTEMIPVPPSMHEYVLVYEYQKLSSKYSTYQDLSLCWWMCLIKGAFL